MEERFKLVEQVYYDSAMATHTIEKLLKELEEKDNNIKSFLNEILDEYISYNNQARDILESNDQKLDEPGMMAKMGSSMGVMKEVKKDNSDSAIADMMIQGITMGSTEIEKKLSELGKDVEKEHKKIAERFLKFQEKTIDHLKKYL